MSDETNQDPAAELEVDETSVSDNSDSSVSDQNSGDDTGNQDSQNQDNQEKKPKIWQVVRGIQKTLEDIQKNPRTPQNKATQTQENKDSLSSKDLYALMDAKVPQIDVDEVVKAAKILGKSVPETLQDGFMQARLKDLAEQRKTANATNTDGSRRTSAKMTDEQVVQRFYEGKSVDPEALAVARMNLKKAKK